MRDLFSRWPEVEARLTGARTIALFLDFDGTLAGFKPRPEDVLLQSSVRGNLARLARSPRFQVCVITGRRRADIAARIGIGGIHYLGLHGWEDGNVSLSTSSSEALEQVKQEIRGLFASNSSVWLEDKAASLAVHHRGEQAPVRRLLAEIVAPQHRLLRVAAARNVLEIVPREIGDKGRAVRLRMSALGSPALPVYVGDDFIDEPAFHALQHGVTVHVGKRRKTRARYSLAGVPQVHALLARLASDFA